MPRSKDNTFDSAGGMLGIGGIAVNPNAKPAAGERTGPQNTSLGSPNASIPLNLYQQAGGNPALGMGGVFPGAIPGLGIDMGGMLLGWNGGNFVLPKKGTWATYRMMSQDPTLRVVRNFIYSPIIASQWTIQVADGMKIIDGKKFVFDKLTGRATGVPKWAVDFISSQILPLRSAIIREALRFLEFGFRPFERVYEIGRGGPDGGRFYTLKKLKPLLPEYAQILHDDHGNFGGLTAGGMGLNLGGNGNLAPNKSWIISNDVEAGNLYGVSRHEASADPWAASLRIHIQKMKLMGKLSGVLPTLYYRPGTTEINGQKVDNFDIAKQVVGVIFQGGAALIPTTEYSDSDLQENPHLAEIASWKLVIEDVGNYSPAMDGFTRENEYQDKLKVRGWGWPERAVLEAQKSGSRADSQNHSESASLDLENVDDDIAAQLSCGQPLYDVPGVVDELLRLNCGDGTQGSILIVPAPLSDPKIQIYTALLNAVFQDPKLAPYFAGIIDWEDMLNHLDVKCAEDIAQKLPQILKEAQAAAAQPGSKPSNNIAPANSAGATQDEPNPLEEPTDATQSE